MRRWWFASLAAVALAGGLAAQGGGPARRVTFRVRLLERHGADTAVLATGAVSGPVETQMRLLLRSDTLEFAALIGVTPEPDSAVLMAEVYTRRLTGRSRRRLPVWEEDSYRRAVRIAWADTARLFPSGPPARMARGVGQWIEVVTAATSVGGATRPSEEVADVEGGPEFDVEAVARPRRVIVAVLLVRGDTVSAPSSFDLVLDAPARRVTLRRRPLELSLARPEPAAAGQDRVLARDVDAVCLRVTAAGATEAARVVCGRLNNVARRLPLSTGDTLIATFGWPGVR